jgi:hypothetical protein
MANNKEEFNTLEKEPAAGGGLNFETVTEHEVPPPLAVGEGKEPQEEEGAGKVAAELRKGKLPLPGSAFKGPIRTLGLTLTELTGYEGWGYTEEELQDIATAWEACGIQASPMVAALIVTLGVTGGKAGGYFVYRRQRASTKQAVK